MLFFMFFILSSSPSRFAQSLVAVANISFSVYCGRWSLQTIPPNISSQLNHPISFPILHRVVLSGRWCNRLHRSHTLALFLSTLVVSHSPVAGRIRRYRVHCRMVALSF